MLSLGKLAPGQQQYYLDSVARGAEEYYTGTREAPGVWVGAGAEALGLAGEVDGDTLARVLANEHPGEGWRLTGSRSVPVVAGFDVTFCAPKSVSLLFALGAPEVSNEVRNATDAAIAAALPVLEREACRVRRGQGGHTVLDGDGFTAAAFRHRTSRAADPHLHTHVVIANVAHGSDGRWSALDGRPLYSWLSPVGHLYEAHLRWELTRRLGVGWGPVKNGIADVDGIDKPVLREFSTRRRQIEAHLDEHGQHSARAAQVATYATRTAKNLDLDADGLVPWWRERAEAAGLDAAPLAAVVGRARPVDPPRPDSREADELYRWLASPEGLTRQASTFGRREVIKAVCDALPAGGYVDAVLGLVDGFLASGHVITLGAQRAGACIRRDDGAVIAARTDDHRYTTPEMLALEGRLLDSAIRRRSEDVGTATPDSVAEAIGSRPTLAVEQAAMVRALCSSGAGVEIVEGVAGAGKTFALAAARDAWHRSGYRVVGCSLAARAAERLEEGAGIPSCTLDRLLAEHDRGRNLLDDKAVVVVDEAAMVGTRKLARLLDHAEHAGAKVVLVGDPYQLPEIEAGGAFRGLQARLGASHLSENRRQSDTWERAALAELRAGDPDRAVDAYLAHDRIHHAPTGADARALLVDEWMNARADGDDVLMVAARLADVDDLNARARRLLQDEGYLDPDEFVVAGRPYARGDDVLALRNNYRLGLLNGTRGVIHSIDTNRQIIEVVADDAQRLAVPFEYAEAGHLTHGYATTIHKAQGATVDRCLVLAIDATARETAYTALSRGRHGNDLYVVASDRRAEERHTVEVDPDPLNALRSALTRRAGKRLATDEVGDGENPDLDELIGQRDVLHRHLEHTAPPDPSAEHRRLTDARISEACALDGARRDHDNARRDLAHLGPIRRRTRPVDRQKLEARIAGSAKEITRHERRLADLDRQLHALAPTVETRRAWEHAHGDDLDRLKLLDRRIDLTRRLDHIATRQLERGAARGHSIEL